MDKPVQVNGILLTPEATAELRMMQEDDNSMIEHVSRMISETVCMLCLVKETNPEALDGRKGVKFPQVIETLCYLRYSMENLAAPYKTNSHE